MRFKTPATVAGIKMFKGDIDGQSYDSTTVFALMEQDETKGTAKGYAVSDFKFPSSELFQQHKHRQFPAQAELELELVSNGKVQKTVLVGVRFADAVNVVDGTVTKRA